MMRFVTATRRSAFHPVSLALGAAIALACAPAADGQDDDDETSDTGVGGAGSHGLGTGGAGSGGATPGSGGQVGSPSTGGNFGAGGGSASGGSDGTGGIQNMGSLGTQVYLLFGQSNMWGVPPASPEDKVVDPDVEVMALTNCAGQTKDEWYPAVPPLHGCIGQGVENPGLGPGDSFAKTIAQAYPDDTILLVPNAIPGVSIDVFAKGQTAYNSIVSRAQKAQERGTIVGMLFHQGETDAMSPTWISRVKAVVDNLRTDLNIPDVPFIAAELPHTGCCGSIHNPLVNDLPDQVDNAHVVSASGLAILNDGLHFDAPANRELGKRYAAVMLELLATP